MPKFLFVVEVPPSEAMSSESTHSSAWLKFASESTAILEPAKGTIRLQQNVWLFPVDNSLPVLAAFCEAATRHKLAYSSMLIPDGETMLT